MLVVEEVEEVKKVLKDLLELVITGNISPQIVDVNGVEVVEMDGSSIRDVMEYRVVLVLFGVVKLY
jgi:hypothetical protein